MTDCCPIQVGLFIGVSLWLFQMELKVSQQPKCVKIHPQ